ncbi:transposase [Spirosoma telluris]|uniref:transposase n=1 Tax=Spirosoma telluris TaxID=2183553 RepID=UPI0038CD51B0
MYNFVTYDSVTPPVNMPQSLTSVYVHLVFSTKYREPLIGDEVKDELYAYLGGICKNLECYPVKIGVIMTMCIFYVLSRKK